MNSGYIFLLALILLGLAAPVTEQWIHPCEAPDYFGFPVPVQERIYQQALPKKLLFAHITFTLAQHEALVRYDNVPVFIGGEEYTNFLCAYIADRTFMGTVKII